MSGHSNDADYCPKCGHPDNGSVDCPGCCAALAKRIGALTGIVSLYAQHRPDCLTMLGVAQECDCGLDAAVAALASSTKKEDANG